MTDLGDFGRVPAAPAGKLYVRDPETGETILVDADPETIDTSAFLSGMADVSDPENPIPAEAVEVEEAEVEVEAVEEAEVVEAVEEAAAVEVAVEAEPVAEVAVEEVAVVEAVTPSHHEEHHRAPAKRGRPKKADHHS